MHADTWLYAITAMVWMVAFIIVRFRQKKTDAYNPSDLDKMNARAAQINTEVLQTLMRNIIESFESGRYTQNPLLLPKQSLEEALYNLTVQDIFRNKEQHIEHQVHELTIGDLRIRQQDRAQMYAVTDLAVTAPFHVRYTFYHAGSFLEKQEICKRRYLFRNEVDGWKLYSISNVDEEAM